MRLSLHEYIMVLLIFIFNLVLFIIAEVNYYMYVLQESVKVESKDQKMCTSNISMYLYSGSLDC